MGAGASAPEHAPACPPSLAPSLPSVFPACPVLPCELPLINGIFSRVQVSPQGPGFPWLQKLPQCDRQEAEAAGRALGRHWAPQLHIISSSVHTLHLILSSHHPQRRPDLPVQASTCRLSHVPMGSGPAQCFSISQAPSCGPKAARGAFKPGVRRRK